MRIAVIGSGAAGITTAYLLNNHHHVTVMEKQPILGGNIRTLNKNVTGLDLDPNITLDNGVIEFQQDHFVQFHLLMDRLGVGVEPVSGGSTALYLANREYIAAPGVIRGSRLSLAERVRAFARLLPILIDSWCFLRKTARRSDWIDRPISDFWCGDKWRTWQRMLLMYAYTIPYAQIDNFPAEIGAEILRQSGRGTKWTRVVGGVYTYIEKILETFTGKIILNTRIKSIRRTAEGVKIMLATGESLPFDKVVLATPPDQVLKLLADPTSAEQRRFAVWRPNHTTTLVHSDMSMYRQYGARFFSEFDLFAKEDGCDAGYNAYLNRLCGLPTTQAPHYGLAYNLEDWIDPAKILHKQQHHTPLYTTEAVRHRQEVMATNGENHTYHAGAYLGNGLHEGAIVSALAVSRLLGGDIL